MKKIALILIFGLTLFSCKKEIYIEYGEGLEDWTTATHTESAPPN